MTDLRSMSRLGLFVAAIISFSACSQGPSPEVQARIDSLQTARDTLSQQLAEQTRYVERLNRQIEQAMGDIELTGEGPDGVVDPAAMENRLTALRDELDETRSALTSARARIQRLQSSGRAMRDSLNSIIRDNNDALAMQRDSIEALVAELETMTARVDSLSTERSALADRLAELEEVHYTVYVAVGTRDELIEENVIEEEGGARVLLVLWKAGETLVPARDLNTEAFRAVDYRETAEVDLGATGSYQMVSRHNDAYVRPTPNEDGVITGETLEITDPAEFWQRSRYLILVQAE